MRDVDELIREALTEEAGRARFDRGRWDPNVTGLTAPRWPRPRMLRPVPRALAGLGVAAVLAAAIAGPLLLLSRLGTGTREERPSSTTVEGYGMRIDLPEGWDGRIVGPAGTKFGPYLQAASFDLPEGDDDVATRARARMGRDDIVVVLTERTAVADPGAPDYQHVDLPLLVPEFGGPVEGTNPPHGFSSMSFSYLNRAFDLWVEFGTSKPFGAGLVDEANRVLATLEIDPFVGAHGYVRHSDLDDGLSITIPAAWTFHQDPSGPAEPRTIFAVGSWPFSTGGECAPTTAHSELRSDGTFFWLIEYRDPQGNDFPQRPEFFRLDEETLATYECSGVPSYLVRFQDAGRSFQVHVAFGPEASESLRPEVLRALDSLEVTAPVPDECPEDYGPWTDPDCPRSAWTRAVVETAGYEIVDGNGAAFEARAAGNRLSIWSTEANELPGRPPSVRVTEREFLDSLHDEGYRLRSDVAGVSVYSDGIRTVWLAQGFAVWLWPVADEPIETATLEALVRASLSVDYDTIDTRP